MNTPARVKRDDGEFLFRRADRPFKEVMVYFHIDRVQRYIQQLGFTNVLNGPIKVECRWPVGRQLRLQPGDQSAPVRHGRR